LAFDSNGIRAHVPLFCILGRLLSNRYSHSARIMQKPYGMAGKNHEFLFYFPISYPTHGCSTVIPFIF
jgi:hypothetical protein